MSSPKVPPSQQKVIPLIDPYEVQEVFADELTGLRFHDGVCHLTYSVVRPKHTVQGTMMSDPDVQRIVVNRLVIPMPTLKATMEGFRQLLTAMEQDKAQQPAKPN